MSKNLTRKGLALGAIVALGSSLFAGAPAFAGSESAKIALAPKAGTTYTTLIGASFDLKNEVDATIKSIENKTIGELSFLIGNPSAQPISVDLRGTTSVDAWTDTIQVLSGDTADFTGTVTGEAAIASVAASKAKFITVAANPASQSVDTADIGYNTLRLTTSTDSTDPFSVTVQAFIDDNNNGEIDTFELTSPVRTVNFIKASAATVTTTVTSAAIGGTTLKGTIAIGNDVNMRSLVSVDTQDASQIQIKFFKNTTVRKMKVGSSSVDSVDVQWDATGLNLTNTTYSTVASVDNTDVDKVTAGTYTAKAYFIDAAGNYILLGAESSAVSAVAGTNVSADNTDYLVATANTNVTRASGVATTVRTGFTGAVVLGSRVLETDNSTNSDPWAAPSASATSTAIVKTAGLKVLVTLAKGTTFTAGHEITAGGKTLTSTSGAVSYETTTDKDGKVSISAVSNKGTKGESYTVKVQVLTTTGWEATGDTTTVTFADATVSSMTIVEKVGTGAVTQVAKGGTLPLNFDVRDSFGAPSAVAGTYRVKVSDGTTTVYSSTVSAGKASYNWVDNTVAATGSYTITATLQKLNTAGDAYVDQSQAPTIAVHVGTAAAAAVSVPANATTGIALAASDFVSQDLRLDANSTNYTRIGLGSDTAFTVNGTVTAATGAVIPGASVTIAAKGIQFLAENTGTSDATLTLDSITVRANASGAYSVKAYSHTAGDVVIAVTSGSATKSVTAKWSFPTSADKDSKITVTGSAKAAKGSSNSYVIALTDTYGNAIKSAVTIKVELSGAGYLTSTPTAVSAVDGKASVTLVLQPADAGTSTIKATYDVADSDTDVVGSLVINAASVASATTAAIAGSTKRFFVSVDGNTSAKNVVVKVAGKTFRTLKGATAKKTYVVAAPKGSHKVTVFVGGKLVATKTISVK